MRRLALPIALTMCACTCGGKKPGGVEVHVDFTGFRPGCIEVVATDSGDMTHSKSATVVVTEDRTYTFAIALLPEWSRKLDLLVIGHEHSCTGAAVSKITDGLIDIPYGAPIELTYHLKATDKDGDGYVQTSDQGTDCDDNNPAVHPNQAEVCSNDLDDDCNGRKDCFDSACDMLDCAPADGQCRPTPGRCQPTGCVQVFADAGTGCDAGQCRNDGTCVPLGSELDCGNGIDDNMNGQTDCADPSCNNASCNKGLCTTNAKCTSGACMGTPKDCGPAAGCHDAGVCNPANGDCVFPMWPAGTACDDSSLCTTNDVCDSQGRCAGTMSCTAATCGTPFCDAGRCDVAPGTPGGPCSDGVLCTYGDTCNGTACIGMTYSCTGLPAPACQMSTSCLGDGGCAFGPLIDGTPCTGGQCVDGGCVPTFPYVPSNVMLAAVPPQGDVLVNCRVVVNTDDPASTTWCGAVKPKDYAITQAGSSEPAVVMSMNKLTITSDGGQLRAVGSKPLIVLVWDTGVTQLDGLIDVRSTVGDAGAGSNRPSCGAQSGLDGFSVGALGSGGGGAAYAFFGQRGGTANGNAVPGGDGGVAIPASYSPLLGGCPGGRGGDGTIAGTGGRPGAGGGAVQVSVAGELRVGANARITASGSAGPGVENGSSSGGGGAGSGGMLLLEAGLLTLRANAWLTANGGAGTEGADDNEPGHVGDDGDWLSATNARGGGTFGGNPLDADHGGNGGYGAAAGGYGAVPEGNKDTGGGGGASVGRIYLRSVNACTRAASFSPDPETDGGC